MMRRFLGLGTLALFTAWTAVGSAQDYYGRVGAPAGGPVPIGSVVVVNGPITQTGGCSACAAAAAPAVVGSCGCKAAQLAFQPCACAAGARVVTVGCSSCSTGGCATGNCGSCGCGLPVSACEAKPRAYCQPRAVVIPNPCACSACSASPCSSCAAAATPCGGGCSTPSCACGEHRAMFPILARLGRLLSFDFHESTGGTCRSCNTCSTCASGSCASGSCASGSCASGSCSTCAASAGVTLSAPLVAAAAAPTSYVQTTGATLPAPTAPTAPAPFTATPLISNAR